MDQTPNTRDIAVRAFEAITRHLDDCEKYRRAVDERRIEDNERSEKMHSENQTKMDELRDAIMAERAKGGWTVAKYLISALGTAMTALGVVVWYVVTHGKP